MEALLYSKNQAALLLNLSVRTVENLLRRGELATRKVGKRTMIPRVSLEEFAKKGCSKRAGEND